MFPDGVSYLPRGSPGNLQKFPTTILRYFIRGTPARPPDACSNLALLLHSRLRARTPMVMKYRGTLTRCAVCR